MCTSTGQLKYSYCCRFFPSSCHGYTKRVRSYKNKQKQQQKTTSPTISAAKSSTTCILHESRSTLSTLLYITMATELGPIVLSKQRGLSTIGCQHWLLNSRAPDSSDLSTSSSVNPIPVLQVYVLHASILHVSLLAI